MLSNSIAMQETDMVYIALVNSHNIIIRIVIL